jgi:hypothetical protein
MLNKILMFISIIAILSILINIFFISSFYKNKLNHYLILNEDFNKRSDAILEKFNEIRKNDLYSHVKYVYVYYDIYRYFKDQKLDVIISINDLNLDLDFDTIQKAGYYIIELANQQNIGKDKLNPDYYIKYREMGKSSKYHYNKKSAKFELLK